MGAMAAMWIFPALNNDSSTIPNTVESQTKTTGLPVTDRANDTFGPAVVMVKVTGVLPFPAEMEGGLNEQTD